MVLNIALNVFLNMLKYMKYLSQKHNLERKKSTAVAMIALVITSFVLMTHNMYTGVSWPSGLVHRTLVLVLPENQNVGSSPGSGACVLEQDT